MSDSRNILFLQSSSELYGSGKIFLQVLRVYQEEGFQPVVVLTNAGPIQRLLEKEGIPVYVQNLGILRRKYLSPWGLFNRAQKNLQAFNFLTKLHQTYQFEFVYSNTLAVVIGAYWANKKKIPHTWHIHEILLGPKPLVWWLSKMLDSTTPHPIAVSKSVGNHWQSKLKKAKLNVIYNGIPYAPFLNAKPALREELGLSPDQILIGMVGRINPGKGQGFFLEMAQELISKYPQLHFVLVGDPFPGYEPILDELLQKIQNEGIGQQVSYLGFRDDIPEIMASLDIFVLPSTLPDSFPTVILEAMAAGKPIVATQSGGAIEMVEEGKTGFLIPIGDVNQGVVVLSQLIEGKDLREKLGKEGQNRVLKEFSLEAFKKNIKNHLWQQLKRN
ncbi:glycosyltransferase family 1 protein [Algoriphagus kandeliae]|uniref:Glycosyltransferase family 1 protein n=1 Tax=Algoriphagus kandeliae TaxID=2562278 RepID=A0A4Y9QWM9_9BACT|nr:glycosyltransferase family 4 protein [Algoriphagus kandeliae]TFV95553.1 glycosyltransferase family 1 protein [Algoriphagus kandeliae]